MMLILYIIATYLFVGILFVFLIANRSSLFSQVTRNYREILEKDGFDSFLEKAKFRMSSYGLAFLLYIACGILWPIILYAILETGEMPGIEMDYYLEEIEEEIEEKD